MRVSSNNLYDANVSQLNNQQSKLLGTQQQLATGRRILTPADDPFASSRALEISQSDSANTQLTINRNAAKHTTAMAETILESITSLLQDVRTSAVADGSGALTLSDRKSLASELKGQFEGLTALANSTDGIGNYLFSGFQGRTKPFVKGPGGIQYMGDDGQRMIQVDSARQMATSDSGADLFMRIKNGNGKFVVDTSAYNKGTGIYSQGTVTNPGELTGHEYKINFVVDMVDGEEVRTFDVVDLTTQEILSECNSYESGKAIVIDGMQVEISGEPADCDEFYLAPSKNESIFKTLTDLVNALIADDPQGGGAAAANYTNNVNRALNNIDRAMVNITTIRTSLGARMRELDSLQGTGDDIGLQYKYKLSELQDVDFNKAISELNQQQTSLTAAQKSFKQVSDLSLFNYM